MSRRGRFWITAAAVLGVVVLVAAAVLPMPFLSRSPGPVFDILGETDGRPTLQISGARTYPTSGELDITTVAELGGTAGALTVGAALVGWFAPDTAVVPDEERRSEADREVDTAVFDASQTEALAAAATYLGRPVSGVPAVVQVTPGSPAEGVLQAGDRIRRVDGRRVSRAEEVGELISAEPAGTSFRLAIVRGGSASEVDVVSRQSQEVDRPVIGILVNDYYRSDFRVALNLDGIGGPSAGAMFAVGIVDKLTPGRLTGGRHIAGTGTITADGAVGEIGGIDKKMIAARDAGARLFLAPRGNCGEVAGAVPDGLVAVPVDSLDQAITAIQDWRGGEDLESCPADMQQDNND